jgi:ribonuclease P protein component
MRDEDETNVPTKQSKAKEDARVPAPHVNTGRPQNPGPPPGQRPDSPVGLTGRIGTGASVRAALSNGNRVTGPRVVLFSAPGSGVVAAVAGRRVGSAVQRNRARRILRVASRDALPKAKDDVDVVLVARPGIRGAKAHELVAEMTELALRAGVVRP